MKLIILTLITLCSVQKSYSQDSKIMQPIISLFQGMKESNSEMVASSFTENPDMRTVLRDDKGNIVLRQSKLEDFLDNISKTSKGDYEEPIWDPIIKSNDQLAQVWVDYAFYYKGNFSHCGVDLFQLVKLDTKWKIFSIVDTRKKENCSIPDEIRKTKRN